MAGFPQWGRRVGKAQGKTKTQPLWLLTSVLYTDVLKVWCGHVLCTVCFYCVGFCSLILPAPVFQGLFSLQECIKQSLTRRALGILNELS